MCLSLCLSADARGWVLWVLLLRRTHRRGRNRRSRGDDCSYDFDNAGNSVTVDVNVLFVGTGSIANSLAYNPFALHIQQYFAIKIHILTLMNVEHQSFLPVDLS